ncbi:MAG TPA: hypothetical protein VJK49_04270, partial [Candidatus Limnocylindrales bacterium]|nr:hypothetical protein [Candidatus Limnocylindrales bacterium]
MRIPAAVDVLQRDLRGIFGPRLASLVVYGLRADVPDAHDRLPDRHEPASIETLAVIDLLTVNDLRACATRVTAWHQAGLATPLLLAAHEFGRSLDAFPFEFGAILSDHVVVFGRTPFAGLTVDDADLRHACEIEARGHLLHLREGYLETTARTDALAVLLVRSAPAFAALIAAVGRLDGTGAGDVGAAARHAERRLELNTSIVSDIVALAGVAEIPSKEAERLFPPYLD